MHTIIIEHRQLGHAKSRFRPGIHKPGGWEEEAQTGKVDENLPGLCEMLKNDKN